MQNIVGYSRLMSVDEEGTLRALKIRRSVFGQLVQEFSESATPDGSAQGVDNEANGALYAFFEQCMISASFSFQALEAFCNQTILTQLNSPMQVKHNGKTVVLGPNDLERRLTTEEKLSQVLPKMRGVPTPKGKKVWESYARLQRARDATVHLKARDQYTIDRDSLFAQFMGHKADEFPEAAADMIRYFHGAGSEPRWLLLLPL